MASLADSLLGRLGSGRQAAIIAVGVVVTALVFGVSRWATKPTLVPLYSDVPMEQVKKMTDKLTESGIVFQLDNAGSTIMVGSADLARAHVTLAAEAMPDAGRPGLELFDKPTWGMTDFTQRINLRRALEGELERTIGKMANVEAVQVHLALEDDQLFKANERPAKASVTLAMKNGETPRTETVRGIASLVASSVGGLDPERVTIVDSRGQALTMNDDGSLAGLSSRQLAVQREVEQYLEQKADRLLSSLVGNGNAKVQVSASINFDKVERTTQAVDPEKQVATTEQKSEVTPSAPQQGAGYTQTATSFETTRSVETFSGAIGNLKKMTVAVLVADRVERPAGAGDSAPATATAPTVTPRSPEEIARIEALVRNALGVDSTRGDMMSVVSAPFDMPAPMVVRKDSLPTPDMLTRIQNNPKPLIAITALVVLLIVGTATLLALRPGKKMVPAQAGMTLPSANFAELPASSQMQAALPPVVEPVVIPEPVRPPVILPPEVISPEREQAIATVEQRPDAAIKVVREWLRD